MKKFTLILQLVIILTMITYSKAKDFEGELYYKSSFTSSFFDKYKDDTTEFGIRFRSKIEEKQKTIATSYKYIISKLGNYRIDSYNSDNDLLSLAIYKYSKNIISFYDGDFIETSSTSANKSSSFNLFENEPTIEELETDFTYNNQKCKLLRIRYSEKTYADYYYVEGFLEYTKYHKEYKWNYQDLINTKTKYLPVKMVSELGVSTITMELVEYKEMPIKEEVFKVNSKKKK